MARACPERGASSSRRGGKRPGAGAPKGNLNALKHGERSRQFAKLGAIIAASPTARDTLLRLAERERFRGHRADEIAAYIIAQIVTRGLKRGEDRLIALPPVDDGRSINSIPHRRRRKVRKHTAHNQSAATKEHAQS